MAKTKEPPKSDRIRIRDKLDQRMANNPARRKQRPTDWQIKGELFMNCSCDVFCPCVVSLGKAPPTEGHCHTWMAIAIDEGHFEGESLSGLSIGLLVEIPGRMAEGDWRVAVYVDQAATQRLPDGVPFEGHVGRAEAGADEDEARRGSQGGEPAG